MSKAPRDFDLWICDACGHITDELVGDYGKCPQCLGMDVRPIEGLDLAVHGDEVIEALRRHIEKRHR